MSKPRVEIDVQEVRKTDAAILVRDADDHEIWLPLSQVVILEEDFLPGGSMKLLIPEWLAIKKGLV